MDDDHSLPNIKRAKNAVVLAKNKITSGEYDVIILDGDQLCYKIEFNTKRRCDKSIKLVPRHTTIVLTGNYALPEIIDMADIVTEMKEIKHPYRLGLKAKEGIDY